MACGVYNTKVKNWCISKYGLEFVYSIISQMTTVLEYDHKIPWNKTILTKICKLVV